MADTCVKIDGELSGSFTIRVGVMVKQGVCEVTIFHYSSDSEQGVCEVTIYLSVLYQADISLIE